MKNSPTKKYLIRQCSNEFCSLRFPAPDESGIGINCPKCKSITQIVREVFLDPDPKDSRIGLALINNFEIALDNIRSTFNVGAIFRSVDGAGIAKIHLCGITPSPDHSKIKKTALGSEKTVPFETHNNTLDFVINCKKLGKRIWALEKTSISENITSFNLKKNDPNTVLVVGNEIIGIDPDVLAFCDKQIHIPMAGIKGSLNVAIALGIAVYNIIDFSTY